MTRRITVRSGSIPRKVIPPASAASAAGADTDAIHDNVAAEISAITEKVSPVGADLILIEDSAASNAKKRVQITNLPGGADADAIHDNVASEISAITAKATPVSGDFLIIEDSAAANVKKSMTVAALEAVLSHGNIADVTSDDHHTQAHDVASHSDTTATGTELETLTDGSNADSLHVHAASSPALDDITDVTLTTVGTGEVLAKSAGDWINRTLAEAGIEAAGTAAAQDHDHDTPIATHAAIVTAHHTKYTDAEVDAIVATHDAITNAHHNKYLDSEAVTAMGVKGDANALHHDKYTDAEVDTIVATHTGLPNVHHTEAHTVASHSDTTATGTELETLTDGSNADSLHAHAGVTGAAFSELMLMGA